MELNTIMIFLLVTINWLQRKMDITIVFSMVENLDVLKSRFKESLLSIMWHQDALDDHDDLLVGHHQVVIV
jgi:hypothetical protein